MSREKTIKADQAAFELKLLRTLLPRYREAVGASREETEQVDTLLKLSHMPYSVRFGAYRQMSKATMGGMLNSFHKSEIATKLREFWHDPEYPVELDEVYIFIFAIPTSTAVYAIIPGELLPVSLCGHLRFISYLNFEQELLAITRLDDYLDVMWPQNKE